MGLCLPNQKDSSKKTTAEELEEAVFSMAWHLRALFKITTHPITNHGGVHQGDISVMFSTIKIKQKSPQKHTIIDY